MTPAISSGSSSPVAQVLDPDRVALVAGDVGGVGEQALVGADRGPAEGEEVVALGELVEVEQQLLARERRLVGRAVLGRRGRGPVVLVGDRDAAAGAVLLALEGARVVPVPADPGGHRQVGLQRAGLDLLEDRLAQVGEVGGALLGVGVLGLEVRRDLGGVLVAQPLVVVDAGLGRGSRCVVGRWCGDGAAAWPATIASEPWSPMASGRGPGCDRPQRRPRRGGHRRRGAARGGDQRQRRLRLPRRDTAAIMRAVCAEAARRGVVGRRAGVLRRPRELRPGRARRGGRRAARAGGRPGRDAARRSPRRRGRPCATSSRTARSTTG